MDVQPEDVEEALERLRELGAVAEIMGGGRVPKFRHYLYEWLGVDKVELAVMAELLLRGAQTEGELRGRASRMEPIADLPALRTILASLRGKGLIVSLTPEGRGHALTHNLYEPRELERVKADYAAVAASQLGADDGAPRSSGGGAGRDAGGWQELPPGGSWPVAKRLLARAHTKLWHRPDDALTTRRVSGPIPIFPLKFRPADDPLAAIRVCRPAVVFGALSPRELSAAPRPGRSRRASRSSGALTTSPAGRTAGRRLVEPDRLGRSRVRHRPPTKAFPAG